MLLKLLINNMIKNELKCEDMYQKIKLKLKHKNARSFRSNTPGNFGKTRISVLRS